MLENASFPVPCHQIVLVFREQFGGFVILAGEAIDAVAPLVQVLAKVRRVAAGADEFFGRALEVGDGALDRVDLVRAHRQVTVGGGVPEPPGPRVQFGDPGVERFLCVPASRVAPGPLPLRAGDLAERLGRPARSWAAPAARGPDPPAGLVDAAELRWAARSSPLRPRSAIAGPARRAGRGAGWPGRSPR